MLSGVDMTNVQHYMMDGNWSGVADSMDMINLQSYLTFLEYASEQQVFNMVVNNQLLFRPEYLTSFLPNGRADMWLSWAGLSEFPANYTDRRDFNTPETALTRFIPINSGSENEDSPYLLDTKYNNYFTVRCTANYYFSLAIWDFDNNSWVADDGTNEFSSYQPILSMGWGIFNGAESSYDNATWNNITWDSQLSMNQQYWDYQVYRWKLDFKKMYNARNTSYVKEIDSPDYFQNGQDSTGSAIMKFKLTLHSGGYSKDKYINYIYPSWLWYLPD